MSEPAFSLDRSADLHARAAQCFEALAGRLQALLPAGCDISQTGATSVEGCLTGGGLDVSIRVADKDFDAAEKTLEARFPRDHLFLQTMDISVFAMEGEAMPVRLLPVRLLLVAIGGPFDRLHVFSAALLAHPAILQGYNELKEMFEGHPVGTYQAAKGLFINAVLDGVSRGEIPL